MREHADTGCSSVEHKGGEWQQGSAQLSLVQLVDMTLQQRFTKEASNKKLAKWAKELLFWDKIHARLLSKFWRSCNSQMSFGDQDGVQQFTSTIKNLFFKSIRKGSSQWKESIKNYTTQAPEGDWCQTISALCYAGLSSREPSFMIESLAIR